MNELSNSVIDKYNDLQPISNQSLARKIESFRILEALTMDIDKAKNNQYRILAWINIYAAFIYTFSSALNIASVKEVALYRWWRVLVFSYVVLVLFRPGPSAGVLIKYNATRNLYQSLSNLEILCKCFCRRLLIASMVTPRILTYPML